MTTATYTWPTTNILNNGALAYSGGFTNWSTSGTVNQQTGRTGDAAEIDESSKLYQARSFTEYSGTVYDGRVLDDEMPMMLRFYAKPNTDANFAGVWKVQLHLLDSNGDEKYVYDWWQTKWVAETTAFGGAAWWGRSLSGDDWTLFTLPWIQAPTAAGTDVDSDYQIRVNFECGADQGVQLDDVDLIPWPADIVALKLGNTAILSNGYNYPVKYDPDAGLVSELSLIKPYETDNSAIPATTQGTTGNLTQGKYYAWAFTNFDFAQAEESGMPLSPGGDAEDTGIIYELLTSSNDSVAIDFSSIEVPDTENAPGTDNPRITHHKVYRTLAADDLDGIEAAIAGGLWHYEGRVAVGGTFTSTAADSSLPDPSQSVGSVPPGNEVGAPAFSVGAVHNNRLYVAGGATYRRGSADPVANNRIVGVSSGSSPQTDWSRACDWKWFQFDGENERYMVMRFAYGDDNTTSGEDELYLTEDYRGSNSGPTSYRVYPEPGLVSFCEEGQPTEWGADGFFSLEGAEGAEVTLLQPSGDALICCTRERTFVWDQSMYDIQATSYAQPIANSLGCIAPKSGAEIEGDAYWLSDKGVVRRPPGGRPQIISKAIQSLFTDPDDPDYIERDPVTRLASFSRGVHYEPLNQYLLAVKTVNAKIGCDVILAYNYLFDSWDIFRLRSELLEWSWTADDDGNAALLMCDAFGVVHVWDRGTADGAGDDKGGGLLVGEVVSATSLSVTVSSTDALPTSGEGLKGAQLYISSGPGAGQWRTIIRNTTTVVYLAEEFDETPTSASQFQIGSIEFEWNGKDSDLGQPGRVKTLRFLHVDHTSQGQGGQAQVRAFTEFSSVPALVAAEGERDADLEPNEILEYRTFDTSLTGRSQVSLASASGYTTRVQIKHDGPERPLVVRRLAASLQVRQQD